MRIKALLAFGVLSFGLSNSILAQTLVSNDVGPTLLRSPNTNGNLCAGYQDLEVKVSNYGDNNVTSFNLGWSLNGVYQGQRAVATSLNTFNQPNSTINQNLGMFYLNYNIPTVLKVWTSLPNGLNDGNTNNDTLTYTLIANDPGIILPSLNDTTICYNGTLTLDVGYNAYTDYTWSNGTQAQRNTITTPGTHWVWAYSNQGCQAFDTFEVVEIPEPQVGNISISDIGQMTFNMSLSNPLHVTSATWDYGDGTPTESGLGSKSHKYTTPGVYTVKVTLRNECGTIEITREVNAQNATSINSIDELVKSITLYPNPASSELNMTYPKNLVTINSIQLINTAGQIVLSLDSAKDNIDISNLNSGIYQMVITTNKGIATKKLEIYK